LPALPHAAVDENDHSGKVVGFCNLPVPVCEGLPAETDGAIEEVSGPEWFRLAATFKGNSQAMRGALLAHRQGVCSVSMLLSTKLSVPTDGS
jgi:hypothetical protein